MLPLMLKSQRLLAVLGASFALVAPALAGTAQELDWGNAVSRAAEANPELKAARSTLEAAGFQVSASYSPFLPQVSGSVAYTYSNSSAGADVTLINPTSNGSGNWTFGVSATENLFNGFIDKARLDQAKANERGSLAGYEGTRARVSSDLKSAFAALQYAQRFITLSQDII